jgi:hypothetical protein
MGRKRVKKQKPPKETGASQRSPLAGGVAAFAREFLKDMPPEAATGIYGAASHDRWHGATFDIADGRHDADGWLFEFKGGTFVQAIRADRAANIPA